jgi:hypothetical protein
MKKAAYPAHQPGDGPAPLINLATALRLSDARPLLIAAAQARVQIAAAQLEKAKALWLPDVNVGSAYIEHGGGSQDISTGGLVAQGTNAFYAASDRRTGISRDACSSVRAKWTARATIGRITGRGHRIKSFYLPLIEPRHS